MFACAKLGLTESAMSPHLPFSHQSAGQAHWLLLPKPANNLLAHHWQERKEAALTCARTRGVGGRNQKRTKL